MVDLLEAFGDLVGEVILGAAGEIISEYRPLTGLAPGPEIYRIVPSSIECAEKTDESR